MGKLDPEQLEILLHIHQSQHERSLAHLNAIFNAFSLSVTGLMVLTAGVMTLNYIPANLKWLVVVAVVVVCVCIILYIRDQRQASERAIEIFRAIDTRLELFEKDKFLQGKSVLPQKYAKSQPTWMGFSRRVDWLLVLPLVILALVIIVVTLQLPPPPPSP
jgi:type IV secretory pathway VirB3-like protein